MDTDFLYDAAQMRLLTLSVLRRTGFALGAVLLMCVSAWGQSETQKVSVETCAGLYCELSGKGDPIIALHGLGASLYSWRELVGKIPNHQLILIDFRGAGKSPKPRDKRYSTHDQAELIYQFILEKNLKNLTLMGNSYGGAVALLVVLRLLETKQDARLSRLILIGSGGYKEGLPSHLKILRTPVAGRAALLAPRTAVRKVLRDSYYDKCGITDAQIEAYVEPIRASGGRYALLQMAKQTVPRDIAQITEKYRTIKVPTLILWGEDDRILRPVETGCRLHEAIKPSSKLVVIKYAGHVPQEEQPAATICQINLFLGANIVCPPQVPRPPDPSRRCKPRVPPKNPFKECPVIKTHSSLSGSEEVCEGRK